MNPCQRDAEVNIDIHAVVGLLNSTYVHRNETLLTEITPP